jgi:hypothetical protein
VARRHSLTALGLSLAFLALYLASVGGHPTTIDGDYYFRAAESLVLRRSLAVELVNRSDEGLFAHRAPDGQFYGKFAPLQSFAEAPFYAAGRLAVERLVSDEGKRAEALRNWVPAVTNCVISAATIGLMYLLIVRLGYAGAIGLAVAGLLGISTLTWPYAKSEFAEPIQALLLLAALAALREAHSKASALPSLASGLALALLVLAKPVNALLIPVFGLALLWKLRGAEPRRLVGRAATFGISAALGVVALGLYNLLRFGSYSSFGYDVPWNSSIVVGLIGWFLSPGKSVFLYMPVLVLAALAGPLFARRHAFEAAVVGASSLVLVLVYAWSPYWAWSGDWAWGVRFAVPLLPLWVVPLAPALANWGRKWRAGLLAAALLGILVQTLGVGVDFGRYLAYYYYGPVSSATGEGYGYTWEKENLSYVHFAWELSPLVGHWDILRTTLDPALPVGSADPHASLDAAPPLARAFGARYWLPPPHPGMLGLDVWPASLAPTPLKTAVLAGLSGLFLVGLLLVYLGRTPSARSRGRGENALAGARSRAVHPS